MIGLVVGRVAMNGNLGDWGLVLSLRFFLERVVGRKLKTGRRRKRGRCWSSLCYIYCYIYICIYCMFMEWIQTMI